MNADTAATAVNELHDIRGPVGIPGEWQWLLAFLAIAAAALLAVLVVRFFRKKVPVPVAPSLPAWEIALAQLARIEQDGYIARGLVKEYYSDLSGVIRWYIEERFDVRAPEMTTEEFMQASRYSGKLAASQQALLQGLLLSSDMVKFARSCPLPEEMERSLQLARAFVQEAQ